MISDGKENFHDCNKTIFLLPLKCFYLEQGFFSYIKKSFIVPIKNNLAAQKKWFYQNKKNTKIASENV